MARPLRLEFPGARYHVLDRGNYRQAGFGSVGAAQAFTRMLEEAALRFAWRVHAHALRDFRWCSLRAFVRGPRPPWLCASTLLDFLGFGFDPEPRLAGSPTRSTWAPPLRCALTCHAHQLVAP